MCCLGENVGGADRDFENYSSRRSPLAQTDGLQRRDGIRIETVDIRIQCLFRGLLGKQMRTGEDQCLCNEILYAGASAVAPAMIQTQFPHHETLRITLALDLPAGFERNERKLSRLLR